MQAVYFKSHSESLEVELAQTRKSLSQTIEHMQEINTQRHLFEDMLNESQKINKVLSAENETLSQRCESLETQVKK